MANGIDEQSVEDTGGDHREISVAEFFEKNKHLLGFENPQKSIITVVKEAVDNSLDACEEDEILPEIHVLVDEIGDKKCRVEIRDNAVGLDRDTIPKVFGKLLYGSKFHKLQQSLLPDQKVFVRKDGEVQLIEIGQLCDELIEADEGEKTERIDQRIEAPCFNRENGEIAWRDVTHAIRHENRNETFRIETSRGREIEVTGNHSLFGLEEGEIKEVKASELDEGDTVVSPQKIPNMGDKSSLNVLSRFSAEEIEELDWYAYGIPEEKIQVIRDEGEKVRKKPSPESRKRTYYRYNGVDILKDSLEQNYLQQGYLPAEKLLRLGWEKEVEDGKLRTYQVGGKETEIPLNINLDSEFMRFLGLFAAEGHVGKRQAGFTFGSHEEELVSEVKKTAEQKLQISTTVKHRDNNSTRVKVFGSPVVRLMEKLCGRGAQNKKVPNFVFETSEENQKSFLKGLIEGDGSTSHPGNEVNLTSTSKRMAQQVSYLFNMLGVVASWKERRNESNISGGETVAYDVLIHGEDLEELDFEHDTDRKSKYKMLPAELMKDLRVKEVDATRVRSNKAGLYYAAGLGSQPQFSKEFVSKIEQIKSEEEVEEDYYLKELKQRDLVDDEGNLENRMQKIEERAESLLEFGDSDLCLLDVKSVETTRSPEYVYDISVPGTGKDENFVAGNQGALCVKNSRGQQGIGISASAMYAQLTAGEPVTVYSKQENEPCHKFVVRIDTEQNEPEIIEDEVISKDSDEFPGDKDYYFDHGTTIEMNIEAKYTKGHHSVRNYLKHTAIMNPYARVVLREPDSNKIEYPRVSKQLPPKSKEIKPHPHGVELGVMMRMIDNTDSRTISSFLQNEFTRVGRTSAESICDEADLDDGRRPNTLEKDEIEELLNAAQRVKLQSPPTDCLSPIGEDLMEKGLTKELNPEFVETITRKPTVYKGNPFQIECTVGETEIMLEDGEMMPIKEFVESNDGRNVLGLTSNGEVKPVNVEAKMRIPRDHDIYEVMTSTGRSLKVTGNNKLPLMEEGKVEWVRTDELNEGETLATPARTQTTGRNFDPINLLSDSNLQIIDREVVKEVTDNLSERFGSLKESAQKVGIDYDRFKAFRRSNYTTRPSLREFKDMLAYLEDSFDQYRHEIDRFALVEGDMNNPKKIEIPEIGEELGYLTGLIESDGHIDDEYTVGFTNKEGKLLEKFSELGNKLFGVEASEKEDYRRVDSKTFNKIMTNVQDKILTSPDNVVKAWLQGFIEGDGCISTRKSGEFKSLTFCTAAPRKARKVQNALMQLGITSRIQISGKGQIAELEGREIVTQKNKHDVVIYSLNEAQKLFEQIELQHPEKEERRKDLVEKKVARKSQDSFQVGSTLRKAREASDLTQEELSLSNNSLRNIENNERGIRRENLSDIAEQLSDSKHKSQLEKLVSSDIREEEIKSIEKIDRDDDYVYDLQTSEGNFVAGNMIMHNCGLAWGGDIEEEGSFEELRYANKVPLLYKKSACVTTKAIENVSWNRYNISQTGNRPQGPLYISIHIASVWVPFTSEGKEAIANYDPIRKEMKLALQEAGRKLGRYIGRKERREIQEKKRRQLTSYAQEMGPAIAELAGEGDAEKIENQIQKMVKEDYNPEQL